MVVDPEQTFNLDTLEPKKLMLFLFVHCYASLMPFSLVGSVSGCLQETSGQSQIVSPGVILLHPCHYFPTTRENWQRFFHL